MSMHQSSWMDLLAQLAQIFTQVHALPPSEQRDGAIAAVGAAILTHAQQGVGAPPAQPTSPAP